jgi:glycogen operon protein
LRDGGANIAVQSTSASHIDLCLFDAAGTQQWHHRLTRHEGDIHFMFVEGIAEGQHYGLRASGPYDPASGHHFDHHKLLLDPYGRAISAPFQYTPSLSRHGAETAHLVPKAVATVDMTAMQLRTPHQPGLIYELNVRAFTMRHPDVPEAKRGTISALAEPAIIRHFNSIGADTIELMPIAAWIDERHLVNLGLRNAWGYNPVSFFAIDSRLAPGGLKELHDTVSTLHEHGFNVLLDVVFNHTGEGDALGPTLSFRGLDNKAYYRLFHGAYVNDAGTGNTLALDRPHNVELVMDALRHWVTVCGVDGFRFDLATILGRDGDGFKADAPLFRAINADPLLSSRILIAEPWDVGPGGYQLGNFPSNWYEWNDRYRDDVRRFFRGDGWSANALATRLAGSSDIFTNKGRPSLSVNFIAAHDGFTLADLLKYDRKHNEMNGEGNRDGKSHEVTCIGSNAHALLATLLLSRGTPMIAAGDEFGRTQNGNNNAYAQDSEITWLDWDHADHKLAETVGQLMILRKQLADVLEDRFLTNGNAMWYGADGKPKNWDVASKRTLTLVVTTNARRVAIHISAAASPAPMAVPASPEHSWKELFSTNDAAFNHPHVVSVFEEYRAV